MNRVLVHLIVTAPGGRVWVERRPHRWDKDRTVPVTISEPWQGQGKFADQAARMMADLGIPGQPGPCRATIRVSYWYEGDGDSRLDPYCYYYVVEATGDVVAPGRVFEPLALEGTSRSDFYRLPAHEKEIVHSLLVSGRETVSCHYVYDTGVHTGSFSEHRAPEQHAALL